ncbi:MAG: hypothetical protein ABI767_05375 [Rhodanobacter sp.]
MRFLHILVVSGLALGTLSACDSIHDPNVRPSAYLPAGPVNTSSEVLDLVCADGSHASPYGGQCPTEKEMREAEKKRTEAEIMNIHAHGG